MAYLQLDTPFAARLDWTRTFSVTPSGNGSKVVWTGTFNAKSADDSKAMDIIGDVYDAGLKGIVSKAK